MLGASTPRALTDYTDRLVEHYADDESIPVDTSGWDESKRNQVVLDLIYQIDQSYYAFEGQLQKGRADFNIGTDIVAIALGGAGSLAAESTANILAAISAGVAGGRASIDKNYFNKLTTATLIIQMRADRQTVLTDMTRGLKQPTTEYSVKAALLDAVRYHNAGRLVTALANISESASEQNRIAKNEIRAIRFGDSMLRTQMRQWYRQTGNAARLDAWLNENVSSLRSYQSGLPSSIWLLDDRTPEDELRRAADALGVPR